MQDPSGQSKKRGFNIGNWAGVVIFLMVAFGSQILPPLARLITQITGIPISSGTLLAIVLVGAIVIPMFLSVLRSALRGAQRNDTRLPTDVPPVVRRETITPPPLPPSPPYGRVAPPPPPKLEQYRADSDYTSQRLPNAPQFEPIINPKVLGFGVLGALFLLGAFGAFAFFLGMIP